MTNITASRLEAVTKYEARARALLADGFTTKTAQKEAREYSTRAYEAVRKAIMDACLAEKASEARDAVYWGIPDYPHLWKAKHATLVRTNMPAAAEWIEHADRLAILTAEIKASPVVPVPSKTQVQRERTDLLAQTINQALRDQFLAQAPALAAEWDAYVRRVFAHYAEKFGDGASVPAKLFPNADWRVRLTDDQADQQAVVNQVIAKHCDRHEGEPATYTLNAAKLAEEAEAYGLAVAMQWFRKTNGKLGALIDAKLHEDRGGDVRVTGTKDDGASVNMVQQRIIKWAPKARRAYHQFPARIYVNGQFTPFGDYAKAYGTSDSEE